MDTVEVEYKKKFFAPKLDSETPAAKDIATGTICSNIVTANGHMYTNDEWHVDPENGK